MYVQAMMLYHIMEDGHHGGKCAGHRDLLGFVQQMSYEN